MFIEGLGGVPVANGALWIEASARNAKGQDVSGLGILISVTRLVADGLQNPIAQFRAQEGKAGKVAGLDERPASE
jgi:hypothetical protein